MKTTSEEVKGVFQYLDALRNSGGCNMFGAAPYVARNCGMDKKKARHFLTTWMKTFSLDLMSERVKQGMETLKEVK